MGKTWTRRKRSDYTPEQKKKLRQRERMAAYARNRKLDRAIVCEEAGVSIEHLREVKKKSCTSKKSHASYNAAWAAKRLSEERFGRWFDIYRCPFCGNFHLTTHAYGGDKR